MVRIAVDKRNSMRSTLAIPRQKGAAGKSGELLIGNDLRVTRLGFGTMRITGKGMREPDQRTPASRLGKIIGLIAYPS
jgi:hypothetical protein